MPSRFGPRHHGQSFGPNSMASFVATVSARLHELTNSVIAANARHANARMDGSKCNANRHRKSSVRDDCSDRAEVTVLFLPLPASGRGLGGGVVASRAKPLTPGPSPRSGERGENP